MITKRGPIGTRNSLSRKTALRECLENVLTELQPAGVRPLAQAGTPTSMEKCSQVSPPCFCRCQLPISCWARMRINNSSQGLYWPFMFSGLFPQVLLLIKSSLKQGWKVQLQIVLFLSGNCFNYTKWLELGCRILLKVFPGQLPQGPLCSSHPG